MGESSGGAQAASINQTSSSREKELFNLGYPGFRLALSDMITDLGSPGSEPDSVKKMFGLIRQQQGQQFDQAADIIPASVAYQAKTLGYRGAIGAEDAATKEALFTLEGRRRAQAQLLNQNETDIAMQTRDFEMGQIAGLSGTALGSARGFTQNALKAAGYRTGSPWGGAASGAISGAAAGSTIAPGWGTVIGGVVGGIGGYFGSGGG